MAFDITNTIIDYMVGQLPQEFNAGVDDTNPLYLRSVTRHPLQDDPTLRAFYLAVGPDISLQDTGSHWRMPLNSQRRGMLGLHQDHPTHEIGGGYLMLNFFLITGWLPMHGTRESAYQSAGEALRLLERAFGRIANNVFYTGALVTDDGMETTDAGYPQVFNNDGGHFALRGGESEWYPQLTFRFHVYTRINRAYWEYE